jgi:molecular chaperone GrpE
MDEEKKKNDDKQEEELIKTETEEKENDWKKEKQELENLYKRALADYQNLIKNSAKEKSEILKYSLAGFLTEILPIYDNLKTAINTLTPEEQNNSWVDGLKFVIKQFQEVFLANGVKEIKTVGEKFDYNIMEAIEGEGDVVIKEIRPGYMLNDKVIIAARVIVGQNKEINK